MNRLSQRMLLWAEAGCWLLSSICPGSIVVSRAGSAAAREAGVEVPIYAGTGAQILEAEYVSGRLTRVTWSTRYAAYTRAEVG
jgi:hypothetical protein